MPSKTFLLRAVAVLQLLGSEMSSTNKDNKLRKMVIQGILTVAANNIKRKINRFQALDNNSAVCSNQLSWLVKMTANKKAVISPVFSGLRKRLLRSDAERLKQAKNDRVEQFIHYALK